MMVLRLTGSEDYRAAVSIELRSPVRLNSDCYSSTRDHSLSNHGKGKLTEASWWNSRPWPRIVVHPEPVARDKAVRPGEDH